MSRSPEAAEALRRLQEFGEAYAGVLRDCWRLFGTAVPAAEFESLRAKCQKHYEHLFMPAAVVPVAAADDGPGFLAAADRCRRATERLTLQASAIAADAYARFTKAVASTDEAMPKITTLRELHDLWIECGEAAYGAAAHGDAYAEAQAELLMALLELRFLQMQAARR